MKFVFEGATFDVPVTLPEWRKLNPVIKLPPDEKHDLVRYVEATRWFPTTPPRPSVIEQIYLDFDEFNGKICDATLISLAPDPIVITEPLTSKDIRDLMRNQRLIFKFRMAFEEYLEFTTGGFRGYVECLYLHPSVRGEFKDCHYRPIEIIGKDLVIEIDADPRNLQ